MVVPNIRPFGARTNRSGSTSYGSGSSSGQFSVSVRPSGESLGNLQFPRSGFQSRQNTMRPSGTSFPNASHSRTGHSTLNTPISRGQAIRTMGLGAGAIAAAGLGLSGIARAESVSTPRLLSDWLENNRFGFNRGEGKYFVCMGLNPPTAPFCPTSPEGVSLLDCPVSFPGTSWNSVLSQVNGNTITTGTVTERVINDGRAEITVSINVQKGPLSVYRVDEFMKFRRDVGIWYNNGQIGERPPPPEAILGQGADGSINYSVLAKFVNPAPNMEIKFILDYTNGRFPGRKSEALAIHGTGTGTFTEHAADFGFAPGTIGTVHYPGTKVVNAQPSGEDYGLVTDDPDVIFL